MNLLTKLWEFFFPQQEEVTLKRCNGAGVNEEHMVDIKHFHKNYAKKDNLQNNCMTCMEHAKTFHKNKREIGGRATRNEVIVKVTEEIFGVEEQTEERSGAAVQTLFKEVKRDFRTASIATLWKWYLKALHNDDKADITKTRRWLRKRGEEFGLFVHDVKHRKKEVKTISTDLIIKVLYAFFTEEEVQQALDVHWFKITLEPGKRMDRSQVVDLLRHVHGYVNSIRE